MSKISKALASLVGSAVALAVAMGVAVPDVFQDATFTDQLITMLITAAGAFGVTWFAPRNAE